MHKVQVALRRPTAVPQLISLGRVIVRAMSGNAWFPAPIPSLAAVQAAINTLDRTETAASSGTRGLKQARNEARTVLVGLLNRLKANVQGVADENPDFAVAIIESAGMSVATRRLSPKPALAIRRGRVSGSVHLVAKAVAKDASYEWQMSKDGGATWLDLPKTLQAKTTVPGLKPAGTPLFRLRAVTRRGVGDWSDPVSYVVQ
jgi:hypothetical protein